MIQMVGITAIFRHTSIKTEALFEKLIAKNVPDESYFHQVLLHSMQQQPDHFQITDDILSYLLAMLKSEVMNNRYLAVENLRRVTLESNLQRLYDLYVKESDPQLKTTAFYAINSIVHDKPKYFFKLKIPFTIIQPETISMQMCLSTIHLVGKQPDLELKKFFTTFKAQCQEHLVELYLSNTLNQDQKKFLIQLISGEKDVYNQDIIQLALQELEEIQEASYQNVLIAFLAESRDKEVLNELLDLNFRNEDIKAELLRAIKQLISEL